jgi:hypothetical protein
VTVVDAAKTTTVEEKPGTIAVTKESPDRVETKDAMIIDSVVGQPTGKQEEERHGTV